MKNEMYRVTKQLDFKIIFLPFVVQENKAMSLAKAGTQTDPESRGLTMSPLQLPKITLNYYSLVVHFRGW